MNLNHYEKIQKEANYPGRKILRKMGYLSDQKGIINRYIREREGWQEHLKKSREFILRTVQEVKPESVTVLGSGWLLDFPLEEIHSLCPDIRLKDVHHPPQILRKTRDFQGVVPVLSDLTGGMIRNVWEFVRENRKSGTVKDLSGLHYVKQVTDPQSYCISLNVMNQLDILLVDFLKKYFDLSDSVCDDFRKFVQNSHLESLGRHACLVTDVEETRKSFNTNKTDKKKLIHAKLPQGKRTGEWTWDFDSAGLYHEQSVTTMLVRAISF